MVEGGIMVLVLSVAVFGACLSTLAERHTFAHMLTCLSREEILALEDKWLFDLARFKSKQGAILLAHRAHQKRGGCAPGFWALMLGRLSPAMRQECRDILLSS